MQVGDYFHCRKIAPFAFLKYYLDACLPFVIKVAKSNFIVEMLLLKSTVFWSVCVNLRSQKSMWSRLSR